MNKPIIVSLSLALVLGGCASTGPNQTAGTAVGAVGGYAVGRALGGGAVGSAVGAVVGATVGSEVGRSMDQQEQRYAAPQQRVIVEERPVYVERHRHIECDFVRQYDARIGAYRDIRVCH